MKNRKLAKEGETIEWSFDKDDMFTELAGKTFRAEVVGLDKEEEVYAVMAEYGPDYISFNDCKIIKTGGDEE